MKLQVVSKDNKYYGILPDTGWVTCEMESGYENYLKARVIGKVLYISGNAVKSSGTMPANTYTTVGKIPSSILQVWTPPTIDVEYTTYCRCQGDGMASVTVNVTNNNIIIRPSVNTGWARLTILIPGD